MIVRFTPRALRHIDKIAAHIATENPFAAQRVVTRIREVAQMLADTPFLGTRSIRPGTRKLLVRGLPYIVVYRVRSNSVEILSVFHGARNISR